MRRLCRLQRLHARPHCRPVRPGHRSPSFKTHDHHHPPRRQSPPVPSPRFRHAGRRVDRPWPGQGHRGRRGGRHPGRRQRPHRPRRNPAHHHAQGRRGPGDHPSLLCAPAGPCSQTAVSGGEDGDRPGDRRGLLLRRLLRAPVHPGGHGRHRGADGRTDRAGLRRDQEDDPARASHRNLQGPRRGLQAAPDRGHARGHPGHGPVLPPGIRGHVPRPARAQHALFEGVQAHPHLRRLLARRCQQRAAAAHLRHRLGRQEAAGCLHQAHRGSRTA